MKKTNIIILYILLIIPLVSAEITYEQGEEVTLKVPCINQGEWCSNSTDCFITVIGPDAEVIADNQAMIQADSLFNYTLTANDTQTLGEYGVYVTCEDGTDTGQQSFGFMVTPTGTRLTSAHSLVYSIGWMITLAIFLITLFGAIKINGDNEYDVGGSLLTVNYSKYVKMGLYYLSYLLFDFLLFFSWQITLNFLFLDFMSSIFRMMFITLTILAFPLFMLTAILMIIKWALDIKIEKLKKRGLQPR